MKLPPVLSGNTHKISESAGRVRAEVLAQRPAGQGHVDLGGGGGWIQCHRVGGAKHKQPVTKYKYQGGGGNLPIHQSLPQNQLVCLFSRNLMMKPRL